MTGDITKEYTVWCGTCANWHQECNIATKTDAIKLFKKLGWRKTKETGWQCPECQNK